MEGALQSKHSMDAIIIGSRGSWQLISQRLSDFGWRQNKALGRIVAQTDKCLSLPDA